MVDEVNSKLNDLSYKHEAVLAKKLGKWNDSKVKLHVHPGIKPKLILRLDYQQFIKASCRKGTEEASE